MKHRASEPTNLSINPKVVCTFLIGVFLVFTLTSFISEHSLTVRNHDERMKTVVHLDLKGAPPRIEYFVDFFKLLSNLEVDGILVEYEDMFPYSGDLAMTTAANHYSVDDIRRLNALAEENGLEVIPLVQTFGHLEFVLKLDQFKYLRENPTANNTICPSEPKSLEIIDEMIKQVRALHPNASTIHLGADEAYHVAEDGRCREALRTRFNESVDELKLSHIAKVANLGKKNGFGRILVWNDMFGSIRGELLSNYSLGELVEPVVWGYAVDVTIPGYFPENMFREYSKVFPSIVFGSAFKGANGIDQPFSEIKRYMANLGSYHHLQHLHASYLSNRVNTVILTGWQRFWHGSPLCELLPVGIPSLVHELVYVKEWDQAAPKIDRKLINTVLKCKNDHPPTPIEYHGNVFHPPIEWNFLECDFPGVKIYRLIEHFRFIRWKAALSIPGEENIKRELVQLSKELEVALSEVFFTDTVHEFINQNLQPLINPPTPPPLVTQL